MAPKHTIFAPRFFRCLACFKCSGVSPPPNTRVRSRQILKKCSFNLALQKVKINQQPFLEKGMYIAHQAVIESFLTRISGPLDLKSIALIFAFSLPYLPPPPNSHTLSVLTLSHPLTADRSSLRQLPPPRPLLGMQPGSFMLAGGSQHVCIGCPAPPAPSTVNYFYHHDLH